jgi:hypothetical protein
MLMLAALPLALHPAPERVAMIGWGSGLSTHALLASTRVGRLDSIEIEAAMVEQARAFGQRVQRAYSDPRSRLLIDDARTVFASGGAPYDVIVSEPSNPWVNGVASLFTVEFYRLLRSRLAEDGLLVQWMQTYELDDALLASMLAALLEVFPEAEAYAPSDGDLVIVARAGLATASLPTGWDSAALRDELARVGLQDPHNLLFHRIGDANLLRAFVAWQQQPPHSDFLPTVALQAPRARFTGRSSELLQSLIAHGLPLRELLGCGAPVAPADWPGGALGSNQRQRYWLASELVRGLREGAASPDLLREMPAYAASLEALLALSQRLDRASLPLWSYELAVVAGASLGPLPAGQLVGAWIDPAWLEPDEIDLLPDAATRALSMLKAAAQRRHADLHPHSSAVLAADPGTLSPLLRDLAADLHALSASAAQRHGLRPAPSPHIDAPDSSALRGWLAALRRSGGGCDGVYTEG